MARYPSVQYVSLYTDGSAARKLSLNVPVSKPRAKAKVRKNKRITVYIDPVAFMGIVTAVVMLAVMTVSFFQLRQVQKEAAVMTSYVQQLRAENKALRTEFEEGFNVEEISRTAQALGMVPKSEVRHVSLQMQSQEIAQPVGAWARICTFLSGLFA